MARTLQQNGVVERRNWTLVEIPFPNIEFITEKPIDHLAPDRNQILRLVPHPPSPTPLVPPTRIEWDTLFQPLFDKYFNPPPIVNHHVLEVAASELAVPTGSPSSTSVDQDAPSPKSDHDIEVLHMDSNPYVGLSLLESSSKESSSQDVILNNVHSVNQPPEHISKWTKDHSIDNVIGDPSRPVSTRHQLQTKAMFYYFDAFLSSVKPKSYKEALTESY
ncbi:hypothetical protein Tco_1081766 [Tanacetum coccineum]|uniref:Integrase, catalytic region, zinc finger, CCHC-type, peptidase aspartic, catalytic n=1 Tax=Tanacetum coccineum TaxID=301880 RepID=A0ABQ5HZM6_9ASTR